MAVSGLILHEALGFGGHSAVFRATWSGGSGAAKLHDDPAAAAYEADWLTSAAHPGVPHCFGVVEHGQKWAVVMEAVDGWSLADLVRKEQASPSATAELWRQVADILRTVGRHHGDLKPDNIRIDSAGCVHLIDPSGPYDAGTPGYRAPETHLGERGDAGDVYALGALGFEMVSGTPFGPCGKDQKRHDHRVRAATRTLSATFGQELARMLAWDPAERPHLDTLCAVPPSDALASWAGVRLTAPRRIPSPLWLLPMTAATTLVLGLGFGSRTVDIAPPSQPVLPELAPDGIEPARHEREPTIPHRSAIVPEAQDTPVSPMFTVRATGTDRAMLLVSGRRIRLPAEVPKGEYRFSATFTRGHSTEGVIVVDGPVTLVCDAGFKTCSAQ